MKKQFLFLILFVAAIVAGTSNAFGQSNPYQTVPTNVPTCLTPTPLSGCTTVDELHPVQGEVYTYSVVTTAATDDVRWFVVNNADLKDGTIGGQVDSLINSNNNVLPVGASYIDPGDGSGSYILNLGTTHNTYNQAPASSDGTGTDASIEIAWKYFDGFQPNEILLVAYVEGDDGCSNNIAVYRIIPEPAFTIDIAVLDDNGDSIASPTEGTASECVSPIEFATYNSIDNVSPNGTLTVDYGENWVFFIVNGANYKDSWLPSFQISYDQGYNALEASWTYLGDANNASATWTAISDLTGATAETVPVIAGGSGNSAGDGAVPAAGGECIVVRVRIDYGTANEHDQADGTLSFAVTGTAYDNVGSSVADWYDDSAFDDLHYANCTADGFTNDHVDVTITPRPQVEEGTPQQEDKTGQGVN